MQDHSQPCSHVVTANPSFTPAWAAFAFNPVQSARVGIVLTACAVVSFFASNADAKTVQLSKHIAGSFYGTEDWFSFVNQTVLDRDAPIGQDYNGTAGAFRFTDGVDAITAFCIDPYSYLNLSDAFNVVENAQVSDLMDRLFTSAYSSVVDATSAAGFQVALWEIIAETEHVLDVTSGNHSVSNADVGAAAQGFLDGLATASTGGYRYTIYENAGQNQISATPVPLPASALLLLGALGGLVACRRKPT